MDLRVGYGAYKLIKKCGAGAFGQIFEGRNVKSGEEVAIKLESMNNKYPQLLYEASIFKML